MYHCFKSILLATSCLVVSFSVSHPGFSMDVPQDRPEKSVVKSKKSVQKVNKDEDFFSKTKYGNWKFDQKKWGTILLQSKEDESKREYLFEVLVEAASEGEADALERLYAFSTRDMLGIKKKSEERAAQTLRKGLLREQGWVVPIYQAKIQCLHKEADELLALKKSKGKLENLTPGQEELLRLLREVVNTPLVDYNLVKKSELFLETLFPFHAQTWVEGYCAGTHQEDIDTMLARLKTYGYYKYFDGLYQGTGHIQRKNRNAGKFLDKKLEFLLEGVALDDVKALNNLYHYYRKSGQEQNAKKALQTLAIERGKIESIFNFGVGYSLGDLVEKDEQKAIELYTKAADQGFHRAIFELIRHWYSNGPNQDLTKAFQGLCEIESKARELAKAHNKNPDNLNPGLVFMMLGRCHYYGQGVTQDKKQAVKYFREGAELREKNSLLHLARAYQEGEGVKKNFKEAIQYWKTVSTKDPKEIVWMGHCYEERGFELQRAGDSNSANEHFKQAYESYQQAAKKKDPQALYNMASHHYQGLARKKNLGEALKLFHEAAKEGHVEAMYGMGYINLFKLQNINIKLAEEWLQKAADKEHLVAMVDLGWLHETKHQNTQKALDLYKKAADLGNAIAQFNYGGLLLSTRLSEDHTIEDRENVALSYLHKSAEQNFSKSMILLVKYYLERSNSESETGKQNLESAYFWLQKAVTLDNVEAKTLLKELESKVDTEIDEAESSPELAQCLINFEQIENGQVECGKELEIKIEKRIFDDLIKEHDKPESSEDESELLAQPSEKEELKTSSLPELQTTELTELEAAGEAPIFQIEQEETVDLWKEFIPANKSLFKNPKFLRQQLREAGLAFKLKEQECQKFQDVKLSPGACDIISMLKSKKERKNITYGSLYKLFTDPYFTNRGHVSLHKTASGISISAKSFEKMKALSVEDVMTTGTHHNHNKTYKGYNPEFLKNVVRVLEMFGV